MFVFGNVWIAIRFISSLFLDFLGRDFPHSSQKCIAGKVFADLGYCPIYHPLPLLTCSSWLWMAADRGCCKLCWFFAPIPIRPDADAAKRWDCRSPEPVSPGAHIARFQSYLQSERRRRSKVNLLIHNKNKVAMATVFILVGILPHSCHMCCFARQYWVAPECFSSKCHCWPPTPSSHKCGSWPHSQHCMLSPSGAWRWAWNVVNGCKMM